MKSLFTFKNKHSISRRIIITVLIVFVIIYSLFSLVQIILSINQANIEFDKKIESLTEVFSLSISSALRTFDKIQIEEIERAILLDENLIGVWLVNRYNEYMYYIDEELSLAGCMIKNRENNVVESLKSTTKIEEMKKSKNYIIKEGKIICSKELIGYFSLIITPENIRGKLYQNIFYSLLSTIVIASILFLVIYLLISKIIKKPFAHIIDVINKVETGDITAKISLDVKDEFYKLATVFNQMTSKLDDSFKQINEYNEHLEDMVFQRTKELEEKNEILKDTNKKLEEKEEALILFTENLNEQTLAIGRMEKELEEKNEILKDTNKKLEEKEEALILFTENLNEQTLTIGRMKKELKEKNEILKDTNKKLTIVNAELISELDMARRVQENIIPSEKTFPKINELTFGSIYSAMEKLGGDLYDVIRIEQNKYAFLIVDVAGHGVPAALITTMAKVSFNNYSKPNTLPSEICSNVNKDFMCLIGDLFYFLTAYYGILDIETGIFKYSNAGHHSAILYRSKTSEIIRLDAEGSIIGACPFEINFESGSVHLENGDRVLLFTDGIIEAKNNNSELYGYPRFMKFISKNSYLKPKKFVDKLVEDVGIFCKGHPQDDDRAILYFEFNFPINNNKSIEDVLDIEVRKIEPSTKKNGSV